MEAEVFDLKFQYSENKTKLEDSTAEALSL